MRRWKEIPFPRRLPVKKAGWLCFDGFPKGKPTGSRVGLSFPTGKPAGNKPLGGLSARKAPTAVSRCLLSGRKGERSPVTVTLSEGEREQFQTAF